MRNQLQKFGLIALGVLIGVMLSLNFSAVAQHEAAPTSSLPVEELRTLTEVFGRIKSDYVEPVDDKKLITGAINGMVSDLDPHSAYLEGEDFLDLEVGTKGEFGGLGLEVGMEDGFVKVVSPIDDSPAARADIKPGDLIVKLDDTAVKGMTLNDAVKRMRGKPGSQITLTIVRKGSLKPLVVTLTRSIIKIQSVKSTLLEPGYAYLRITQFQEHTGENLVKAVDALFKKNDGPVKGIVLDLRNDPGGLLNGAVAVSAAFLPKNVLVVYTDGRTEDSKMRLTANPDNYLRGDTADYLQDLPAAIKNTPLVVLVNGGSASASEIVAGALQDHKRAVIMGQQTFGKASVQTILPLSNNAALKLTTARYYTPNGRSIQAKGITPDIVLDDGSSEQEASLKLREADLDRHLLEQFSATKTEKKNKEAAVNIFGFKPTARPKLTEEQRAAIKIEPGQIVSKNDYELSQAVAFLKSGKIITLTAKNDHQTQP